VDEKLDLKTTAVSERLGEGRHTTTQARLWPLTNGGYVVDTPGIREMGLKGLGQADLIEFYPEIVEAAAGCRFSDCSHAHEPGCAVRAAVVAGAIAQWRYDNYLKIYSQLPA
jgi:ribosome biogenesis GTPase